MQIKSLTKVAIIKFIIQLANSSLNNCKECVY